MGFLSDLDLTSVDDDPNSFPDGTYKGFLFDAKVVALKDTSKGHSLVLTYKIGEGDHQGKTIDEWKSCNSFDDATKKGWLKQRIKSLGVPESKMDSVEPEDLVGLPVIFSTKTKGQYRNVTSVKLNEGPETVSSGSSSIDDLL